MPLHCVCHCLGLRARVHAFRGISFSLHCILSSPRFACPCARTSRHHILIAFTIKSVCLPVCAHFEASHFHSIVHSRLYLRSHSCISSVCVPVCTHFEASHFHSIVHSRLYLRLHSAIFSICVPVCTHFEAPHFHSIVHARLYLSCISCISCILHRVRNRS